MANPANSTVQNLLPVQAYFNVDGSFNTFIGQGQPFYATANPVQSGLHITNSTIDSTTIGATTPSTAVFSSGQVIAAPTGNTDLVNKQYVDYFAAGLSWKSPCLVASTANIPTLSGLLTVDTITLAAGDLVLVKNQSTASQNGIYVASSGAWTRYVGADAWNEFIGAITFIVEGSQGGSAWYCTAQPGGTLGTTPINWANFSVASSYTAGTGLTLAGTQFSITPVGTAGTYGSASSIPVFVTNASGQVSSVTNTTIAINGNQITSGTVGSSYLTGAYTGITGLGTLANLTVTNPISGSVTGSAATATSATTATNIAGGLAGSLPYQSAVGATSLLGIGTTGQVLTVTAGIPSWATPASTGVTSVSGTAPIASSGGTTPAISISQSGASSNGYLSSTDWNTFNNKTSNTGTVTSVSGAGTVNGLTLTGTVTTSGSLTLGGTLDLSSPPAIGGTTPAAGTFTTLRVNSTISLAGSTGTAGYALTSNGASAPTWQAIPTGLTITDDTTTNATRYLTFTSATSGSISGANTSSTKLTFNPSTGQLISTLMQTQRGYSPNIALTDASTIAWDTNTGQVATFTFVSTNRTMGAPTNLVSGAFYGLAVIQNGGSNTLTWNSVFKWAGGTAPTLSTAAGAKDYFVFRTDGTNLYAQGVSLGVA